MVTASRRLFKHSSNILVDGRASGGAILIRGRRLRARVRGNEDGCGGELAPDRDILEVGVPPEDPRIARLVGERPAVVLEHALGGDLRARARAIARETCHS